MLRRLPLAAAASVVLYGALLVGVYALQRTLFYRTAAVYRTPAQVHLGGTTEVQLVTGDGVHTIAWHSPAPPGAPTLVFFHGNGGSVSSRHWRIRRGQKMGYGVFLVEYRGFGDREGSPSEDGLYADARAALDWLEAHGVPPSSMILDGESLGSGVAVKMATERKVAGVILEAPYTSTIDVAELSYWMFPVRWLMWDRFDSLSRIKDIHAPLLVMHGGGDATIPQSQGRALLAAAAEPKLGYFPPDAHHLDLVLHGAYDQIDQFMARFWRPELQAASIKVSGHQFAERCEEFVPPPPERIDAFIKRAERIVRVEVLSSERNPEMIWETSEATGAQNVIYDLRVVETLKGPDAPSRLRLPGVTAKAKSPIDPVLLDVSFRHEKGLAEAKEMGHGLGRADRYRLTGRWAEQAYCSYAPHFELGIEYLLFLPDAFSAISAEPMLNDYDPWYQRVREAAGADKRWGLY